MSEWATLQERPDGLRLRFERSLKHPPEKVWRAITESAELAHWFPARMDGDRRSGALLRFVFDDDAPMPESESTGRITEFEPPRVFAFSWNDDLLRFELSPDGDGCLLVFTHRLGEAAGGKPAIGRNAAGWDQCLEALSAELDGLQPPESQVMALIEQYVRRFGLDAGEVDGTTLRFERDLVWRPLDDVWQVLAGDDGLEPGAQAPAAVAPEPAVVTHIEPHTLQATADGVDVKWQLSADPEAGHRVRLTVTGVPEQHDRWREHLNGFVARL